MTKKTTGTQATSAEVLLYNYLANNYQLRVNTVTRRTEMLRRTTDTGQTKALPPGEADVNDSARWMPVTDSIINAAVETAQMLGYRRVTATAVRTYFESELRQQFNPLAEYFNDLPDGNGNAVADFIGALAVTGDGDRSLIRRWLVKTVVCALTDHVNDVMLILAGRQGKFKTSFLNHLVPARLGDYAMCGHIKPDVSDKDVAARLAENFLVNVDDQMETIARKDFNSMKSMLSIPTVTFRRPYGHFDLKRRRIASFCGSINNREFLSDTENRRYLCYEVERISEQYRDVPVDSIWADVMTLARPYLTGDADPFDIFGADARRTIEVMTCEFIAENNEKGMVEEVFCPAETPGIEVFLLTTSDIQRIMTWLGSRGNFYSLRRIGMEMTRAGFGQKSMRLWRRDGKPCRVYEVGIYKAVESRLAESYSHVMSAYYKRNNTESAVENGQVEQWLKD